MMVVMLCRGSMVSGTASVESLFATSRIVIPRIQERNNVRKASRERRAPNSFHEKAGRSHRSRDNFPNPVQPEGSYAPLNTSALDDLFDFFNFEHFNFPDH